ncbi:hypothetical protein P8452_30487 [Trifolium repens]|nr:hypothetical protein P8452_30487 [Trifolium repens]
MCSFYKNHNNEAWEQQILSLRGLFGDWEVCSCAPLCCCFYKVVTVMLCIASLFFKVSLSFGLEEKKKHGS